MVALVTETAISISGTWMQVRELGKEVQVNILCFVSSAWSSWGWYGGVIVLLLIFAQSIWSNQGCDLISSASLGPEPNR